MLGVSFVTSLKSNLCKALTKLNTTKNNCIISMHRTQLHLRIWTRIVLYYFTCTEHNCTSGFEHLSPWIVAHAQNATAPQDLNTCRLYYLTYTEHNCTSEYEHVSSWIIAHAQNTTAPQNLNRCRLYYVTCTEHSCTSGFEHVSSWIISCTEHNCTSGFEHVSSWNISHAQNTTAPQNLNTYRPELSHMHRTQRHIRIWTRFVFIISHAQNIAAPQALNTYCPELSHIHITQLYLRI